MSILELLVAMSLTVLVVASLLMVFNWQNRQWLDRQDEAEARLTLQGVKMHLSRLLRSTGGDLPAPLGGIVMHPRYSDSMDLVVNGSGHEAAAAAVAYNGATDKNVMFLQLDSTNGFDTTGYAALQIEIARNADNCSSAGNIAVGTWKDTLVVLPVDFILASPPRLRLNLTSLMASSGLTNNGCVRSVAVTAAQTVYSLDTVRFAKVGDTLYQNVSRQGWFPLAGRIDTISFSYLQPGGTWSTDSVATNANLEIDAVRVTFSIVTEAAAGRASTAIQQYASNVDVSLRNASRLSNTRIP
jgi:hypothetical protein